MATRPRHARREGERAGARPSVARAHPCWRAFRGSFLRPRPAWTTRRRRGLAAGEGGDWQITRPFRHVDTCARPRCGFGRGDASVTDRCTLGQWTCQCRLPLVQSMESRWRATRPWLSPEADGEWRVEFAGVRGRGWPMTTIWVAGRGVVDPHPVPARTRVRLPARERITPAFARRSISFASEARYARSSGHENATEGCCWGLGGLGSGDRNGGSWENACWAGRLLDDGCLSPGFSVAAPATCPVAL